MSNNTPFTPPPKPVHAPTVQPGFIPPNVDALPIDPDFNPLERMFSELSESMDNVAQSVADGVWVNALMARRFAETPEEHETIKKLLEAYKPSFDEKD